MAITTNPYGKPEDPQPTPGVQGPVAAPKPPGVGIRPSTLEGNAAAVSGTGESHTLEGKPADVSGSAGPQYLSGGAPAVAVPHVQPAASAKIAPSSGSIRDRLSANAVPVAQAPAWLQGVGSAIGGAVGSVAKGASEGLNLRNYDPAGRLAAPAQEAQASAPAEHAFGRQLAPGIRDVTPGAQAPAPAQVAPKGIGVSAAPAAQQSPAPVRAQAAARDPVRQAMLEALASQRANVERYGSIGTQVQYGVNGDGQNTETRTVTNHGQLLAHLAHSIADYDRTQAEAANTGPGAQMAGLMKGGPHAEGLAIALSGGDPSLASRIPSNPVPGQSPYNSGNFMEAAERDPELAGYGAMLSGSMPIHEKAANFASAPGIHNPGSKHRQLWDAFMASQMARGGDFNKEQADYAPGQPSGANPYDQIGPVGRLVQSAAGRLGFGANQNQARNLKYARDQAALGYGPVNIGVPGS